MKVAASIALAGLLWTGLAAASSADDPPPFECPLCGGNAEVHKRRVADLSWFNGRIASLVLTGFFQGRALGSDS